MRYNKVIKAIEQAGRSIQKTFGQELNEKISKIFSDVTNGKYMKVVMDDSLRMMVYDGFDYIDMKYLSNFGIGLVGRFKGLAQFGKAAGTELGRTQAAGAVAKNRRRQDAHAFERLRAGEIELAAQIGGRCRRRLH